MRHLLLATLLLAGCAGEPPPCPFTGTPDFAPSAGCLVAVHGRVLVVETIKGGLTPPGGHARAGESAQCAAHREAWEETGLDLLPGPLLKVFPTGFHLYACTIHAGSGPLQPQTIEVRRGLWLPVADFDSADWRFPGQGEQLELILNTPVSGEQ